MGKSESQEGSVSQSTSRGKGTVEQLKEVSSTIGGFVDRRSVKIHTKLQGTRRKTVVFRENFQDIFIACESTHAFFSSKLLLGTIPSASPRESSLFFVHNLLPVYFFFSPSANQYLLSRKSKAVHVDLVGGNLSAF